MKKKIALLLSLLAAVLFCFGLAACKQKGVTLKDFPEAETQTVALGSVYELKTQAEGEDGNTYRLTFQVRTRDDAAVPVFDDRFDVTDTGGYVITYTAVTDGVTQTSVVTLDVTDDTAPTISISKPENGSVGEEYELPVITVSDLAGTSPEVTVKVYLIREGERTEITSLSERGGRYYFTPESVGTYEIEVTAVKTNGQSKTATRSFNIDEPVAEGEVFSPEVVSPESQISFVAAGGVETDKLIVETAEETQAGSAYTGRYLSVNGKDIGENVWVDIHLTPRLAIEDYADFDVVEFWVYFQTTSDRVKIGILGGSTAASDPLLREFAGNTWAKVSIDADTFFDLIDSKRLFTVNFNNPASGNHAGVQEVRIGSVTAKYAFAPAVTVDAPAAETDKESEVTLTVDTDAAFTARIEDHAGNEVPCTVEGNVVRANLPMGTYTYTLTSEDSSYVGSFSGTFTVEGTTQIVLPEAESGIAGKEYTIPDALISVNGEVQEGIRAECKATFVQGLNGKASENVLGSFTPLTFGTLTLSYTYESAAPKTMTVEIAPAQAEGSVLFDPSTATDSNIDSNRSEQKFTAKPGDPSEEYTGSYLELTAEGYTEWANTRLKLDLNKDSYKEYEKIGVWVYFEAQGTVTHSLFNDNAYKTQYAANRWHLILVDREAFIEKMTAAPDLLAIRFHTPGNGNFPNLTAARLGAIVAVNALDEAVVEVGEAINYGETTKVTITVNGNASDLSAVIRNTSGKVYPCTVNGNVITADLPIGVYRYEISSSDPAYAGTLEGRFSVENRTQIVVLTGSNYVAGQPCSAPGAYIAVDGKMQPDASPSWTAYFVSDLNGGRRQNVTGTFTPLTSGTLTAEYSYYGAESRTVSVRIRPAEATGNTVYSPATWNDELTSQNGRLYRLEAKTSDDAVYSGSYFAVTLPSKTGWEDMYLALGLSADAYSDYDKIGIWVYAAADGNVNLTPFNNAELKATYTPNEWHLIVIDRDVFMEYMSGSGPKRLFPLQFGVASAENFPNMTEFRLGAIVALYAFDEAEVTVNGTAAADGNADISILVENAKDITAVIKNAEGIKQTCSVNGRTITAQLPAGVYTYEITTADSAYTGTITGSFTVESDAAQIVLPDAPAGVAGEEYIIPDATVTIDGETQTEKATFKATFVQALNGKAEEIISQSTFTPVTAGTLTIEYSYSGAVPKTLTVEIAPAEPKDNVIFDASTATGSNLVSSNGIQVFEAKQSDGSYEGSYIRITAGATAWTNTRLSLGLSADSYQEYDKVGVWVYFAATNTVTSSLFNDNTYKTTYAPNEWHLILVDRAAFIEKMTGSEKDLLALAFAVDGKDGSANFPGLTEVRLGAIVALHSFDEAEVSVSGTVDLGAEADVTFTIGEEASDITVKITDKNGETTTYAAANGTVTVQFPVGNYTYEITTADPYFIGTIEGTFAVESKVKIVLPEAEDGVAGEEYTIPDATVTIDGQAQTEKATFTATFVQGLNGAKEENVTGSFTPITAGTLTIVYSYEGAASVTLTVEIAPAEPKDNVIFDASTATADNFTSTSGSLHTAVADGEGNYISIKPASNTNVWSNLKLHIDDVSAFAEYDVISFRVYFVTTSKTVKIGILGGSTGDTDPLLRTFPGNTWANVTVDAETFFSLIASKMLFPVNFNSPNSQNHANVTEVRLGAIVGLYELDDATVPGGLYAAEGGTTEVVLTVNQDAAGIFAVIKDAYDNEQTCTVSGSTITAELPVGVYTFEITTSDPRYTGKITGSFTVESSIQIVTPQLPISGTALEAFTIPQAQIKENGELTEKTATCTAVFKPTYNSDGTPGTETPVSSTFTPSSSGTLTITYTYDGALEKVFTVTIGRAAKPENVLLDLRNNDVLADVSTYITDAGKSTKVSYNEEGKYLVWTDVNSSSSGAWPTLGVNFQTTQQALKNAGVAYLKLDVYYQTTGSADPTGFFCNQKFQIGSTSVKTGADNIPRNSWYTVYIPVDYLTDEVLRGQHSLIQTKFGTAGNWNFDNVQEVRLKGFVPVTENEIPDGMFIDMGSLGADSVADVFGSDYGTQLSYVAATDSERAYLSWTAGESTLTTNWCNLKVKPLASFNAHDLYDYIAVELYYVGEADKTISWFFLQGGCTANTGSGNRLTTNEWITVYLPIEKYFGTPSGGSGYFMECMFDNAGHTHFPGISEVRIGNIFFTNTAGSSETDYVFTLN
ncbi:MAG TPA: hypothetical protein H9964_05455 [Candidatus Gallimonas intestinavium]|uniref:Uncharacterized protein n=1 Tax=Candidatus Gallimonas intestinavium TaxID=2838603 RepID=A0A9D2G626_9FIRM|nr:hypothetical protein [Candidatus Gallimonas intestinavium]